MCIVTDEAVLEIWLVIVYHLLCSSIVYSVCVCFYSTMPGQNSSIGQTRFCQSSKKPKICDDGFVWVYCTLSVQQNRWRRRWKKWRILGWTSSHRHSVFSDKGFDWTLRLGWPMTMAWLAVCVCERDSMVTWESMWTWLHIFAGILFTSPSIP